MYNNKESISDKSKFDLETIFPVFQGSIQKYDQAHISVLSFWTREQKYDV